MIDSNFVRGNYFGFPNKKSLQSFIRENIIYKHPNDTKLSGDSLNLIMLLINRHPRKEQKVGAGIESIIIRPALSGVNGLKRLEIIRKDGVREDFSWLICLEEPKSLSEEHRLKFINALRYEISD